MFGLKSDPVRRDAIKLGNSLTFKQVYDLAKVEESTRNQMEVFTLQDPAQTSLASNKVFKPDDKHIKQSSQKFRSNFQACYRCGGSHQKHEHCPTKSAQCKFCGKISHFIKVCIKKKKQQQLHEIEGQEDNWENNYNPDEEDSEQPSNCIGTVTSISTIHSVSRFPDKLFAKVKLNGSYTTNLKIEYRSRHLYSHY